MREDILLGALLRCDLAVLNVQSEVEEGQGVAGVGRFHFELEGGMAVVELVENAFGTFPTVGYEKAVVDVACCRA